MNTESKSELSYDLNRFDTKKYAKFIKGNISSILNEAYETTFKKIIDTSTSLILNDVHQKMSGYIYNYSVEKQVDIEGEQYINFYREMCSIINQHHYSCWLEGKLSHRGEIIETIDEVILQENIKLIYIKKFEFWNIQDGSTSPHNYIYVFSNMIIFIRTRHESNGRDFSLTLKKYEYSSIPSIIIDIFNMFETGKRDYQGCILKHPTLNSSGFDSFMNEIDSLIKKFEQNPFYFVSGNSRFYDDIMIQKIELEQQLESFKREKTEFEAEKETILRMRQEIESSIESEAKLEEMKKENIKRLRILKKIKQEKLQLEQERKKLQELKESIESLEESDIDEKQAEEETEE